MKLQRISESKLVSLMQKTAAWNVVWDIETAPLPDKQLALMYDDSKLKLPPDPGPFDPMSVAYGNTVDPEKRARKLAQEQSKHERKQAAWPEECAAIKDAAWNDFRSGAALDPTTGQIVAIGYGLWRKSRAGTLLVFLDIQSEAAMLENFWAIAGHMNTRVMAAHHGNKFDIPFCVKRSWVHRISFPYPFTVYKTPERPFVDTEVRWMCGDTRAKSSLDAVCKALGVAGKLEGVTGEQFAELLETDKKKAMDYLESDVVGTFNIARITGLLDKTT